MKTSAALLFGRFDSLASLLAAYRGGMWSLAQTCDALAAQLATPADSVWIARADMAQVLAAVAALEHRFEAAGRDWARFPLFGVPFAVKDNIDAAGFATTAACREFAYQPTRDATVVRLLVEAGALLLGKTNLDQFATGLNGTRSPYGAVANAWNPAYISGGSSSGSAVAVARGLVAFSLGTDTAGSGRIPAAFNHLVGLKPTRGAVSTRGVVPACRTLDCVSVFAHSIGDAAAVLGVLKAYDANDPFSRVAPAALPPLRPLRTVAVPDALEFFGDAQSEACFAAALRQLEGSGIAVQRIPFAPLLEVARLLYDGPWVGERHAAIAPFLRDHADKLHPVVREIIESAGRYSASDTFQAVYRLAELKREADALWRDVDALFVPSAPTIYTIAEMEADPVRRNANLGIYTNFVNLLDWSALALPAGFRSDGLPFGVTLIAPAWHDEVLLHWARQPGVGTLPEGNPDKPLQGDAMEMLVPLSSSGKALAEVQLAVVGAHLSGQPLNHQLVARGATLLAATTTAPVYALHALAGTVPPKPGLQRLLAKAGGNSASGTAIAVEVWNVPLHRFGEFVAEVPAPLGIGSVELADGSWVKGFICEPWALDGAIDISGFGGWRSYLDSVHKQQAA